MFCVVIVIICAIHFNYELVFFTSFAGVPLEQPCSFLNCCLMTGAESTLGRKKTTTGTDYGAGSIWGRKDLQIIPVSFPCTISPCSVYSQNLDYRMAIDSCYADKLTQFTKILKQFDDGGHDPSARAVLNTNIISPLVISHCNGVGSWSFSDATIDYTRLNGMPLHLWYNDPVMKIISELQKNNSFNTEQRKAFECVLDFFNEGEL